MKPGQNPLVVLTTVEEMASQLSQQNFHMAPNQSLIQFLSILPNSSMKLRKGLAAMDFSLTKNRSSWQFVPDTRTFNVSVRRVEGERTPACFRG